MDARVSGDDGCMLDADLTTAKISDYATSFPDQKTPRRNVPGGQALLPEAVKPSRRDIGQIQRCRPWSAYAARAGRHSAKLPLVFLQSRQISEGKTGGNQRELRI